MSESPYPHQYAEFLKATGDFAKEGGVLFRWNGIYWGAVDALDAEDHAYDWLANSTPTSPSGAAARAALDAAMKWIPRLPSLTDAFVIPCMNGYVHLEDCELVLRPPDRTLGLRHGLSCAFEPHSSDGELFQAFLNASLPDVDVQERVQEYVGYTLTADARYQLAQIWLGSGANGKGVLSTIVRSLHARPEAIQLDSLDKFRLAGLVDASLVVCDEIPRGRINEQLLKSLIAGEPVQIDRKHQRAITKEIRAKWLILGNHLPNVDDQSEGFWRRWDIVPFNVTVPESSRNPMLATNIVRNELSSVLNWALAGLVRLSKRGRFSSERPHAMRTALLDAQQDVNQVAAWCNECDVSTSTDELNTKESVYAAFNDWARRNGMHPYAAPVFWKLLKKRLPVSAKERIRRGGFQLRTCNVVIGCR